jgi:hypothetical protein
MNENEDNILQKGDKDENSSSSDVFTVTMCGNVLLQKYSNILILIVI